MGDVWELFFGQIKKPLVSRPTHIFFRDLSNVFLFVKFAGITCFKICVRNGKHIPQFDQCIRNLSGELVITGGGLPFKNRNSSRFQNMGNRPIHPSTKKEKVRTRN